MTTNSRLSDHLDWAADQLRDCRLCPRKCGVNRSAGETGWCAAGDRAAIFMEYVHFAEESELTPSHTVFLTGCNLGCAFCHTARDRREGEARELTVELLQSITERGRSEGARNINLLGGEPTVSLASLLPVLNEVDELPPVIWNSNMYCSAETLRVVDHFTDVYLADFKFGNNECALAVADAPDYWDVVPRRLAEAYASDRARLMLRHLVLPGHIDCCTRPVLEWIAEDASDSSVSLKLDYLVMPDARADSRLGRFLATGEAARAKSIARGLGLRLADLSPPVGEATARQQVGSGQDRADGRELDVELVISPSGNIFVRHPTSEIVEISGRIAAANKEEEES